jgi:rod shape-determining protein MreC
MEVARRHTQARREIITFGVLVVISLALIFMGDVRQLRVARGISMVVFYPFEKGIAHLKSLSGLHEENAMLKQRVTELAIKNQQLREFDYENASLRKLVAFKQRGELELVPAEVIARDPNRLAESFVIDRGKDAGLVRGMPVVTAEGIIGKLSDVSEGTSLVETIYSRDFRVSCLVMKSRVIGILKWEGGVFCSLEDVPVQVELAVGDTIVSSGLGGVFPKGIMIGTIASVKPDNTMLFYAIEVAPAADLSRVEEVFVVKASIPKPEEATRESERMGP